MVENMSPTPQQPINSGFTAGATVVVPARRPDTARAEIGDVADPGQTMFVFRAEPGSGDEHSLMLLAEIAAGDRPAYAQRQAPDKTP